MSPGPSIRELSPCFVFHRAFASTFFWNFFEAHARTGEKSRLCHLGFTIGVEFARKIPSNKLGLTAYLVVRLIGLLLAFASQKMVHTMD